MSPQQSAENFIGRQKEIELFTQWLATPNEPWIFYIYDALSEPEKKGGVGKTRLLRRYATLAKQANLKTTIAMIDFFSVADRDGIAVAERLVQELQVTYPDWSPTTFIEAVKEYRSTIDNENVDATDSKLKISDALTTALQELEERLHETDASILIFFDTFELIELNPTIAALSPAKTFPDNYHFDHIRVVMAGRNALDWTHPNWQGREQEVRALALEPFNQQEMLRMFEAESIYEIPTHSEQEHALYARTEGRPIIIGLTIDVVNHRILTLENLLAVPKAEFESYLVPQINQLENPLNWVILVMAHVYHHFNMAVVEWLLSAITMNELIAQISREELERTLPELSFVRQSSTGNDFVLHDEMRRLVTKYCWDVLDSDKLIRKDISRSVVNYYEEQMGNAAKEPQHEDYIIEILYHRLFVDLDDGLRYFLRHFSPAISLSKNTFGRLLLYELQKFADHMSLAQHNEMLYAEATLLRSEENPAPALNILQQIRRNAEPQWLAKNQLGFLTEEGWCYSRQGRLSEALDRFSQALEIAQAEGSELQSARLLSYIGGIFRRKGQFSTALNYYERSMAVYRKLGRQRDYARTLTDMSIIYRLQGKLDEALRRCKVAWHIRLELFRQGTISEDQIGRSLNVLGGIHLNMGDIVAAERCFREAFDIFLRVNYKGGIAIIYNRLGQVQLLKGELTEAQEWFLKAQEASREIEKEQYINSLNKQGRIHTLQQQWAEAIPFFEQAITAARQILDYYQQTENLIDLADALGHLEQKEHALQFLQEAEVMAIQENYADLRGQIEEKRGAMAYGAKEYELAFRHFILYCHHMSEYNFLVFKAAVHRVVDAILGIPKEIAPMILQEMLTYWSTQQLDKSYPELIQALEEVENLMTL